MKLRCRFCSRSEVFSKIGMDAPNDENLVGQFRNATNLFFFIAQALFLFDIRFFTLFDVPSITDVTPALFSASLVGKTKPLLPPPPRRRPFPISTTTRATNKNIATRDVALLIFAFSPIQLKKCHSIRMIYPSECWKRWDVRSFNKLLLRVWIGRVC